MLHNTKLTANAVNENAAQDIQSVKMRTFLHQHDEVLVWLPFHLPTLARPLLQLAHTPEWPGDLARAAGAVAPQALHQLK